MSRHLRRLSTTATMLALSILTACGGGGGGSGSDQQNLSVEFDYGPVSEYPLWLAMEQDPDVQGLEGHTPKCEVISGSLPAGVTVGRNTCKLSGTPEELGVFSFTVRLSVSGFSGSVTADGSLMILPPQISYIGEPLDIRLPWKRASTSTPSWWGYQPVAGDVLSNFHVEDAELPIGMSIDPSTGVVSGTFTGFSTASFTIHGTITHNGRSVDVSSPIIEPPTSPPTVFYPGDVQSILVGQPFTSVTPRFDDDSPISGDYTGEFTVELQPNNGACSNPQPLPAGLTLNSATGVISGTPTEPSGCVAIKYTVSVPMGGSVSGWQRAPVNVVP